MKQLTERDLSDAKRLIYALTSRIYDVGVIKTLVRVLNYCDSEQLIRDINALDKMGGNAE